MPKRLSHLLAIVFAVALTALAQTNPRAECPKIAVEGPLVADEQGHITFTAVVDGRPAREVTYEWKVYKGQIVQGYRTPKITVLQDGRDGGVTATVTIRGLPEGCNDSVTETSAIIDFPYPILIDEVEVSIAKVSDQTLRAAVQEQKNNPSDNLYIIAYTDKDISPFDVRKAVKKVADFFIKEMKLTSDDFEIEIIRSENNVTKFYRLPPGAAKPSP